MIEHHTKIKGDIGVLKAKCDLAEKGYLILSPETEHAPFDLAVWKDGQFMTIQVKYRKLNNNGQITLRFSSYWADRNGTHENKVDKKLVDWYCVYCPDTDQCYYINPRDFNSTLILRVEPPRNGRIKDVNLVENFMNIALLA